MAQVMHFEVSCNKITLGYRILNHVMFLERFGTYVRHIIDWTQTGGLTTTCFCTFLLPK